MINVMAGPWHGKSFRPWQSPPVNKRFVFEVRTTASPETFALPLEAGGNYDFYIDWGDGNSDSITVWNDAAATHTYTSAGTYIISVSGAIQGWRFNNAGDKLKIYDIKSWGPLRLGNSGGYFYGCSNLTVSATDIIDLTGTIDFARAFFLCSSLTTLDVSTWDVAAITNFYAAFRGCSSLITLDVGTWDTSAVTTFNATFRGCFSLTTLDVSAWDVAAVITFQYAFHSCSSLTILDVSTWDISAVTNFYATFYNCSSIAILNVSAWNTSAVTTFSYTFHGCSSLTTLALNNWDITLVTTMGTMLLSVTLTTANYSAILIAFEAQAVLNNVPLHGGNSKYSAGAAATARAALIADHSWTITDGGQE